MTLQSSYVIEVGGKAVGLVVRELSGFRFFGSDRRYAAFERQVSHYSDRGVTPLPHVYLW